MFPIPTYESRRAELVRRLGSGLALFLGNRESPMNYAANVYPFRQDSSFLYYFGIDQPGYTALLDADSGEATVFADDLTIDDIVWTGPLPSVAELAAAGGVADTRPAAALSPALDAARRAGRTIHFLPPYRGEHAVTLLELLAIPPAEQGARASLALVQAIVAMRTIKSDEEIAEIERAVDTTIDMHLAAMRMARPGLREADIAARVTEVALAAGGQLSFPVIATVHGETLHNTYYGNTLKSGDLFLLDCGAEAPSRYAGDLTSTFPVDPTFTPRQREVYDIVLAAHLAALDACRPGVPYREVHRLASRRLADGLSGLGLLRGNLDDAVEAGAHALFFQCGVGHMLGMDIHDMENLGEVWVGYDGAAKSTQFGIKSLRLARPLEPGFVLTVEPGLYFIPELLERWRAEGRFAEFVDYDRAAAYAGFGGVRVEENIVVTDDGARILGKWRPRTADEVEAVRAGG